MTKIFTGLATDHLDNDRFVQMKEPFVCELDTLRDAGLKALIKVPKGFVMDFESVPITRGRNKRGGTVHDYLSCIDSDPVVTKAIAAEAYLEMNAYTDEIDCGRDKLTMVKDWLRRWSKWGVVRVWPGYFHQRKVMATCKEIAGIDCDPYITIESAIKESKETTAAIKEIPATVEGKQGMVEASEKVTDSLKEAKEK